MELLSTPSNSNLRQQFLNNFGRSDKENVDQAKDVMRQLKLVDLFRQFESRQIEEIESEINQVSTVEIRPILYQLLKNMRGRKLWFCVDLFVLHLNL